jgi:TetR/AcrR family transcriptional repressor of nem operon
MARRTTAEKAKTHEEILKRAARTFRAHGSAVGIGDVMHEAGLTHGGFYRHFSGKDQLFGDAVAFALDEISARLEKIALNAPRESALEAIISAYLSTEHLKHPETWCALAALGPDIARAPAAARKRLEGALGRYMERMMPFLPGADDAQRQQTFLLLFSGMSGAIAMARLIPDASAREHTIAMARTYYIETFARPKAEV